MRRRFLPALFSLVLSVSLLGPVTVYAGATEGDVCRIDTTGYTTLGSALSAVTEGKTIVLLADIAYDGQIAAGICSFSIDLAGHGLSVTSAQVYCLAATGGKQLSISNSTETESRLTVTQAVAAADASTASGFGAVYASGKASRIVTAANVDAAIVSNVIGMDAGTESSIQIGKGTIRAERCGIDIVGAGSVLIRGDVYGLGSGADGVSCRSNGDVQVNGTIHSNGIGVNAQSRGHVGVDGDIVTGDAVGNIGVYASSGASVQVTGDVDAATRGVFAEGGTISVEGTVTAAGADSIGAYSKDTLFDASQGTVTVTGSVYGKRYGAYATEGGTVLVGGDAYSTAGTTSYASAAVYSRGVGSMAVVTGRAVASGQNSSGIEVNAGGTAEVRGNITALEAASYGVKALSGTYYETLYGSTATVDGTITATKYILIGAAERASDSWNEMTPNGYFSFYGAYPLCYVYVKAPSLQTAAAPSASPAGGAVASGTAVVLATATSGAEIRYTLDGTEPTGESTLYAAPLAITAPVTVKAAAFKSGMASSSVTTESYTILSALSAAETPAASPAGGAVPAGTAVVLTTATSGAEIRYTLDGTEPTAVSALYTGPIAVTAPVTIRAVARMDGLADSAVLIAAYTIQPSASGGSASFVITASAGTGGSIAPAGKKAVAENGSAVYSVAPQAGYLIADVLVDGVSVGRVSEYRFSSVRANHTIEARFVHDCPSKAYTDVDTALWYHEGIDFVLSKGLFMGTTAVLFEPDSPMTRAMAAMIFYRLAGSPSTSGGSPFSDVPAGAWYSAAVTWGADTGLVEGYGDGSFRPNDKITREQFAVILCRCAKNAGRDVAADKSADLSAYGDAGDVSDYALTAVEWACGMGLMQGDEGGRIHPKSVLRRAEAAVLLMRLCRGIV